MYTIVSWTLETATNHAAGADKEY